MSKEHARVIFDPADLARVMARWEAAECDCCSPNALDEGLDSELWFDPTFLRKVIRFGLRIASAAQYTLDDLEEVERGR